MTSSSVLARVGDDGAMESAAPEPAGSRSERPLRRSFTAADNLEHHAPYEAACEQQQAEIARLRGELDRTERRLATTETALDIMGQAHALMEHISKSATPTSDTGSVDGRLR